MSLGPFVVEVTIRPRILLNIKTIFVSVLTLHDLADRTRIDECRAKFSCQWLFELRGTSLGGSCHHPLGVRYRSNVEEGQCKRRRDRSKGFRK